jgi:hypothetical protein
MAENLPTKEDDQRSGSHLEFKYREYQPNELLPPEWGVWSAGHPWRVFNPSIARLGDQMIMCYRVVGEDNARRLAICKLDANWDVVPNSILPLSDWLVFPDHFDLSARSLAWHADPRIFTLKSGYYIYWNDGSVKPHNNQFIVRVEPSNLKPLGRAQRILLKAEPTGIEKNWTLFEGDDGLKAIYSISPLRILRCVDQSNDELRFADDWEIDPDYSLYENRFGHLRGGAAPATADGTQFLFCHSSIKGSGVTDYFASCVSVNLHAGQNTSVAATPAPIPLPNPHGRDFRFGKLNQKVGEVIYPCGSVYQDGNWIISYGVNDERCLIAQFSHEYLRSQLRDVAPISHIPQLPRRTRRTRERELIRAEPAIPLFYWQSAGKLMGSHSRAKRVRFKVGNFGDIASKELVEKVTGSAVQFAADDHDGPRLLSVGSIIHRARNGDIIWGSGVKGGSAAFGRGVTSVDVYAVRGPITYDFLKRNNINTQRITELFDPVSLIGELYRDEINSAAKDNAERVPCIIVPHYREYGLFLRKYPEFRDQIVSPDGTLESLMLTIAGAERVVSSSLHGIIVAEALGIPAVWLAPQTGEDELKYYDYYLSSGRFNVKRHTKLRDAIKAEPMELPVIDTQRALATFPSRVLPMARPKVEPGQRVELRSEQGRPPPGIALKGFNTPNPWVCWTNEVHASISCAVDLPSGKRYQLRILARAFNPSRLPKQRLNLKLNGRELIDHEFEKDQPEARWLGGVFRTSEPIQLLEIALTSRYVDAPVNHGAQVGKLDTGIGIVAIELCEAG